MALSDAFVKSVKHKPETASQKHTDGHGLYLQVGAAGKYWRMSYRLDGKQKTLALGVYPDVSLAKARQRREAAREQVADGIDPGLVKKADKLAKAVASANTFEVVAREWLGKTAAERKANTHDKITTWLTKDVFPHIGKLPIASIGPRDVLAALRVMEARGALDSVQRVKQITGQVFRYAVATGSAERDITQDLKGALAKHVGSNFAAITEPAQAGQLMRSIYSYSGHPYTVAALKLAPLVFVRPGELRTAEWAEFDLNPTDTTQAAQWRIPGSKMKMKADHIVQLCSQAVGILRGLQAVTGHGRYVFPSIRTGERPMSDNTLNAALRAMGYDQQTHTAHGFRAMARTILDEVLHQRVDLIEHQLSHQVKDATGTAYNRTKHLPARMDMMQHWADYLDKLRVGGDVIQFRAA